MRIIVLDGNQRSSLCVVRSLGRKGVPVIVGEVEEQCLASSSKYSVASFQYHSPYREPDRFVRDILAISIQNHGSILLPMTDVTLSEILPRKTEFSNHIRLPFPDFERYSAVSDKESLFRKACHLGVPSPRTLFSSDYSSAGFLLEAVESIGFPVVLKPATSRIRTDDGWVNASVCYAADRNEFEDLLHKEPFRNHPFLVQEKIQGPGVGVFLLMREGRTLAHFAHRRIREKPPSGGVSVLCESIEAPVLALAAAKKLLEYVSWTGVAMVEFKQDSRDDTPKLMEVNGRFWGSLQLAVSSGVDFPYLLYCQAMGENCAGPSKYRTGVQSRWELGDLDHLIISLKQRDQLGSNNRKGKYPVVKSFLRDFFKAGVRNEVFRSDDPKPFLFELRQYLGSLCR